MTLAAMAPNVAPDLEHSPPAFRPTRMTNLVLVLLRVFVETNQVPGYVGGPEPTVGTNGWLNSGTLAIAVYHPPRMVVTTNYVFGTIDGTNRVELLTVLK